MLLKNSSMILTQKSIKSMIEKMKFWRLGLSWKIWQHQNKKNFMELMKSKGKGISILKVPIETNQFLVISLQEITYLNYFECLKLIWSGTFVIFNIQPLLLTWYIRERVSTGAVGAHNRRSLGYHLLHPLILRLSVLCVPNYFEAQSSLS